MSTTAFFKPHPVDDGISPWSGEHLYFDSSWEYLRNGEHLSKCVADGLGVVIYRFCGWSSEADWVTFDGIIDDVIVKMEWQEKPLVVLFDCTALGGMDISARGKLIEVMFARKELKGVVFCAPSYLIKSLVQLTVNFYQPEFSVAVCGSWEESCLVVGGWLALPHPVVAPVATTERVADEVTNNKDIDAVLKILGQVEWNKPGVELLERAAANSPWKPFLDMMTIVKSDIDTLIVKREERVTELRQSNQLEAALQKKMSRAFEESQRANVVFEHETKRNLMLSRVMIDTQKEILFSLGEIIESRSRETANHIRRVAEYSTLLARLYGMSDRKQQQILHASPMHDAGKIAIPDSILNKPGKLTDEEFTIMKDHARLGWEMLKSSQLEIMQHAATIAHQHHEKWNGKGYPNGLRGEEIDVFGRMSAIADVFDALGSSRCYKNAWPLEKVLDLLQKERGEHFDPQLIDLFFGNLGEFLIVRERFPDAAA